VLERAVPLLARRERQAFTIVERGGGQPGEGRRRLFDADRIRAFTTLPHRPSRDDWIARLRGR
jgi:hypothetical protein